MDQASLQAMIMAGSQGIVAIATGFIVQGLKNAGMDTKYAFLAAAAVGAILGVLASFLSPAISTVIIVAGIFTGIIAGASASGFYSGGKKYMESSEK